MSFDKKVIVSDDNNNPYVGDAIALVREYTQWSKWGPDREKRVLCVLCGFDENGDVVPQSLMLPDMDQVIIHLIRAHKEEVLEYMVKDAA